MYESELQDHIRVDAPNHGCILMRNNSGVLLDQTGRPVRYGLMNDSKKVNDQIKSSDLIGFTRVTITPEMVGQTFAVFTAVEVKRPGWILNLKDARERAQQNFIEWIKIKGGFAGFAQSVDDLKAILFK